jgi:hypothetical protein
LFKKYRLYIDETGNSDLGSSEDVNHRYLSLTGVVFLLSDIESKYYRELEQLKSDFFGSHPDDPIVLHRKELVNRRHPFVVLRDPDIEERFNERLLSIISDWNYKIITVTIDKLLHNEQYSTWKYDPYHYCLKVMLERYVRLLMSEENSIGDVMIESRGGKEDMRLKKSFTKVWEEGSDFVKADQFQNVLTSKELKVKAKTANITGLQIADLLAHPASKSALCYKNKTSIPDNFGGKIIKILEAKKFYRSSSGVIEGWGRKWLP